MPVLDVRALAVTHDGADRAAPSSATLEVAPGEVVLLLGPSGSGKSTLALAANGLIPQTLPAEVSGTVHVAGADAATTPVPRLAQRVGVVFQDPDAQIVTASVLDEAAFGPENLRLPVTEVLARAEAALRRVDLWHRRDDDPEALSGGGRQRLAIAAALALGPRLLVLDEPTANLDPEGITEVYRALAELVSGGERSVLLIEHDLDDALEIVNRIVVLDAGGRTVMAGPVDDVLRRRAGELVALGVWLPTATLAALRLRRAGYALDPLPLTPAELRAALERIPSPGGRAAVRASARASGTAAALTGGAVVRVRGLTVARGRGRMRRTVLSDVDLDVPRGAFVAIVGRNGAGKSTLAQAIAGVQRPPRGTVHVGGVDVSRADPRTLARTVGFVFQNPEHQFLATSVREELAHGLRMQRLPAADIAARTDELLDRFGLADHADRHPFTLSGGQKRRLSVGTALVAGAPVLVLDEPTFGQDRARADELLDLLEELRRAGTTIVVVTHDMQLVAEHADTAIVLSDGRVVAAGDAAAVLADEARVRSAGLRTPPLARALRALSSHPELSDVVRLRDLPGDAR
ncbi:ABC transporter ATP-binding protein [Microbacterium sp. 10M-3C3]|jgi:energy-coupling factor transport system ATP-binding protein|uniref:ABC transporter ATP-binding protein n=1 Tax=Microbacterium sp. 10M-3C3 TaxID=2483401 RepID=UPI000F62EEC1|nr:ABC transporter ATP-binding protein [Microbacterium sp. 10M-3C3]